MSVDMLACQCVCTDKVVTPLTHGMRELATSFWKPPLEFPSFQFALVLWGGSFHCSNSTLGISFAMAIGSVCLLWHCSFPSSVESHFRARFISCSIPFLPSLTVWGAALGLGLLFRTHQSSWILTSWSLPNLGLAASRFI